MVQAQRPRAEWPADVFNRGFCLGRFSSAVLFRPAQVPQTPGPQLSAHNLGRCRRRAEKRAAPKRTCTGPGDEQGRNWRSCSVGASARAGKSGRAMLGVAHQIKKSGIKTATTPVKKATKTASYTPILPNPLLRAGGTVGVRRFGIKEVR